MNIKCSGNPIDIDFIIYVKINVLTSELDYSQSQTTLNEKFCMGKGLDVVELQETLDNRAQLNQVWECS